ncbi:MAG: hypothetical protein JJU37_12780 [Balneolaceae bacterium]|nr:hypothetical protein [Balneolaceae bacterium]
MMSKLHISIVILSFMLLSCDATQTVSVQDNPEIAQISIRFVMVPPESPMGPGEERDMMAGSLEAAPDFNPLQEPGRLLPAPFGCYGSQPHRQVSDRYIFRYFNIYFDKSVIEQADNRFQYTYWRASSPDGPNGNILGIWHCYLPMTDFSEDIVVNFLESYFDNNYGGYEYTTFVSSHELDNLP